MTRHSLKAMVAAAGVALVAQNPALAAMKVYDDPSSYTSSTFSRGEKHKYCKKLFVSYRMFREKAANTQNYVHWYQIANDYRALAFAGECPSAPYLRDLGFLDAPDVYDEGDKAPIGEEGGRDE